MVRARPCSIRVAPSFEALRRRKATQSTFPLHSGALSRGPSRVRKGMRKVVIHRAGSYGELRIETCADVATGPGQVAIDVKAAGVNYADCIVRMGLYESAKKY